MKEDFEDAPKSKRYEPTLKEILDLGLELKKFPQKEINGKLVSPFDQYLVSIGVISFGKHMQIWCKDPAGYERLAKTNARLELRQYHEQEKLFQQFPEERVIHWKKIHNMGLNLKGLTKKITA